MAQQGLKQWWALAAAAEGGAVDLSRLLEVLKVLEAEESMAGKLSVSFR